MCVPSGFLGIYEFSHMRDIFNGSVGVTVDSSRLQDSLKPLDDKYSSDCFWLFVLPVQDANVKLIRELRTEIKRLKAIIAAAKLQDSDLIGGSESFLEENIHKKEEMVRRLGMILTLRHFSMHDFNMYDMLAFIVHVRT